MKYIVTLTLSNGNTIRAKINGHSESDAVKNLQHNNKVVEFMNAGDNAEATITSTTVDPIQPRYYYRSYSDGTCICLDTKYGFQLTWILGRYKDTAKAERLAEKPGLPPFDQSPLDELETATEMRKIGEWISLFHYDDAFDPIHPKEKIATMLRNAMEYAGMNETDLSDATGVKLNSIHAQVSGERRIDAINLYTMVKALGAELRIVFPEDE